MKKEKLKRIAKRITAFAAVVFCGLSFGDYGLTASAAGDGIQTPLDVSQGNIVITDTGVTVTDSGGNETSFSADEDGYVITGTTNQYTVTVSGTQNITLAGVNIDVSATGDPAFWAPVPGIAAFKIADGNTGNVVITLADGTANTLKGGFNRAGLEKNGEYISADNGKLIIQGDVSGTGALTATGGDSGAGIGSSNGSPSSNITIKNCIVTAIGGSSGASIGGGCNGDASNIVISGGSVKAGAIGGGGGRPQILPKDEDGNELFPFTVENPGADIVQIDGNIYPFSNHTPADSTDTNLYLYLEGKIHNIKVGSNPEQKFIFDFHKKIFGTEVGTEYIISGGVNGVDYSYLKDGPLTIVKDTALEIKNNGTINDSLIVASSSGANITLNGVNVNGGNDWPFTIEDTSGDVVITLPDGVDNVLTTNCGAIAKYGSSKLTIQGGTLSTGSLTATSGNFHAGIFGSNIEITGGIINATGGDYGTGIGGRSGMGGASDITISGGIVTAIGGTNSAGIGSTDGGSAHNIKITGGIVTATAGDSGSAGIGGGLYGDASNIVITGGSVLATKSCDYSDASPATIGQGVRGVKNNPWDYTYAYYIDGEELASTLNSERVYLLELTAASTSLEIDGNEYPINHGDGKVYAYLTEGEHTIVKDGVSSTNTYMKGADNKLVAVGTDLTVTSTNGGTLTYGNDYTYEGGVLTIKSTTPITIANANTDSTTDRIEVADGIFANITLAGVNISSSNNAAFKIADNCTGNVTITLAPGSENTLISANTYAGLQKNGTSGSLEIKGTGKLTATGGEAGAGIGGGLDGSGSNITISGGTVTATGNYGAGIGGGFDGSSSNIIISGGSVKASSIGAAPTLADGTTNVYLREIANDSGSAITINGKNYPTNHNGEAKIYAYLPAKSLSTPNVVNVGSTTTYCYYDITNSKWINVIDDVTISIDKPTAGDALATSAAVISPSTGVEAITSSDIVWKDASDNVVSGTAGYNKEYTVYVTLNASSDYAFKTDVGATVNTNGTATVTENNGGTITVKYKFGNTDAETEIDSVDIVIDEPTAGSALVANASVSTTGVKTTAPTISWTGEKDTNGNAKYNTEYTASVTLAPDTGYKFASNITANIKTSASGSAVGTGTVTPNATDGTITVEYAFTTAKAKLISITDPTAITGVANGTTKTAAALGLPSTVTIETEDTSVTSASVSWDVSSASYDPSVLTEQTFSVSGTVTLPTDIDDNNISLDVTISVTVSAADTTAAPTASPIGGTYTDNQSVVLSCTTQGAVIYYSTDGTTPTTSSTQYAVPISVTGTAGQSVTTTIKAIAVKDGMQNSSVATFTYIIEIPVSKYLVTVNDGTLVNGPGDSKYAQGETVTITVDAPESGKQFKEWTVNNGNITLADSTSSTTTFIMPANAVEVTATYEDIPAVTHTITATAGANGSISPSGSVTVADNDSQTFTITPDNGYEIDTLMVDGGIVTATTSYTFTNVTDNHTISVTFKQSHTHSYGTEWKSDSTSHWHECECGEKADIAAHISDNGVVTLQPTETSEGIMTYSCSVCDYILRTETIPAIVPEHTHEYGTEWKSDSSTHWHECSCGEKTDIAQHISNGGIVTVQPTATSTGLRVYSCSVCGYVLRTETIPATGYNYPSYPSYPTYPTYPFDSSIFNVVTFTDKVNVTAETNENTITLKWDKVEKADKYYVYQYKNGKYVKVKTTSDTSVTFKKLKNGETYKFLIRYTKSGRLSPTKYSGTISVKVYYKPIPKPTATKNSIKLTWDAVPEAEKYAVYKYVDGKVVKLTETKKLSVKIGKLTPDTEYKYIVRAYVDGKWTTMLKSDIVTVKTKAE